MARIPKWGQELKERIESGKGYQYENEGKKATWRSDFLKDLPTKQYGRSYDDKLTTFVKQMGGDEKEANQFRTWMNQRESGELQKNIDYQSRLQEIERQAEENRINQDKFGNLVTQLQSVRKEPQKRAGLLGFLDRYVVPVSQGAKNFIAPGLTEQEAQLQMERKGELNPITKAALEDRGLETDILQGAGYVAGAIAPVGQGYKIANAALKGTKLAKNAGNSLANRLGHEAVRGTTAAGVTGVGQSLANEGFNPDAMNLADYTKRTGIEMAIGGVADPAVTGVGRLFQQLRNVKKTPATAEQLASPAPKTPKNLVEQLESVQKPIEPNEWLQFGQQTKNIPKARFQEPDIRVFEDASAPGGMRPQGYWKKRYEDFVQHVNNSYDTNQLTQEALEDAWTQFARPDEDVNLEQLIDLYGKDMRRIQEDIAPKLQFGQTNKPQARFPSNQGAISDDTLKLLDNVGKPSKTISDGTLNALNIAPKNASDNAINPNVFEAISPKKQNEVETIQPEATLRTVNINKSINEMDKNELKNVLQHLVDKKQDLKTTSNKGDSELVYQRQLSAVEEDINVVKGLLNPKNEVENIRPAADDELDGLIDKYDGIDFNKLKDVGGIRAYTTDIYRVTKDVFKGNFNKVKESLLDPFDKSKGEFVDYQKNWLNKLDKEVVKGLGIKKGSKLSKLVQDYGEKTITLDELKQKAPNDWQKVVEADKWFRSAYDELIDQANIVRAEIYPNSADKLVPKRDDYYRHFRELNGLEGIRSLFDTPAGIDPQLVGTSDFTTPKTRWASYMQKRGKGPYKSDAVGGFLDYLPAVSYSINIDPHIKNFRDFSKTLKEATGGSKNLNTYIEFLEDFANDLSGKTNPFDRGPQKVLGRKVFGALNQLNTRVKKNVILGNVGSVLAQLGNIPQGVGFAKHHSVPGAIDTVRDIVRKGPSAESNFLKERFSSDMYNKFDTKVLEKAENFAGWFMTVSDRIGTTFIWNSAYRKGLAKNVENPVKYADDETRKLVAGRGIGEVPLAQKAKVTQILAPFQLEVANLWKVQRDMVSEKDFGGLITLYAASWVLNDIMKDVRGSGVSFDPMGALEDAFKEEDATAVERGGRLVGEVLSNVPFGQTLSNFYPEYGTKNLPTREQFFGDSDPNRFGTGLFVAKGVQDPLFKIAPPFGGNQANKTIKGITALNKENVYNQDETKLKYPVERNTENKIKGTLFGLSGMQETRDYYDNDRTPLSEGQTKVYQRLEKEGLGQDFYNLMRVNKDITSSQRGKFTRIENDKKLTDSEKLRKLIETLNQLK